MNIKKIIKRVEAMKIELKSIRKEVDAEDKRVTKLQKRTSAAREKLEDQLRALPADDGKNGAHDKNVKLRKQIDEISDYENVLLGQANDYPEDSLLGAVGSAQECLDELVRGKGKKLTGHLPEYEAALVAALAK
jgi:predicted  nucleic acid-binding Zn-ribbon protein